MRIPAICLAAGRGSRLGRAKPAADLGPGTTVGAAAVRALAGAGFAPVIAVVRPDDDLAWLEAVPSDCPVRACVCPDAELGISRSIRRGLEAALEGGPSPDAVMIALADMPFLAPGKLAEWRSAWTRNPGLDFVAGRSGGTILPPVLWPRGRLGDLLRLEGDAGAGALIRSGALRGAFIELTGLESLDLDTPEQLEEARVIWHIVMRVHGAQSSPASFIHAANSMSPKLTHP
jgi:molybdenum cofactor cytidylyltransferase